MNPERNVFASHEQANFDWFDMPASLERDLAFLLANPNAVSLPSAVAGQPAQPMASVPKAAGQLAPRSARQNIPDLVTFSPPGSMVGGGAAGQAALSPQPVEAAGQLAPHPIACPGPAGQPAVVVSNALSKASNPPTPYPWVSPPQLPPPPSRPRDERAGQPAAPQASMDGVTAGPPVSYTPAGQPAVQGGRMLVDGGAATLSGAAVPQQSPHQHQNRDGEAQ